MEPIGKGSSFLYTLTMSGLGELSLKDANVNVRLDFYAKEKKDSVVTGFCTVKKSDIDKFFVSDDDDNIAYVLCNTSDLDYGAVSATMTVEYIDEDTNAPVKQITPLTTEYKVVDALLNPSND